MQRTQPRFCICSSLAERTLSSKPFCWIPEGSLAGSFARDETAVGFCRANFLGYVDLRGGPRRSKGSPGSDSAEKLGNTDPNRSRILGKPSRATPAKLPSGTPSVGFRRGACRSANPGQGHPWFLFRPEARTPEGLAIETGTVVRAAEPCRRARELKIDKDRSGFAKGRPEIKKQRKIGPDRPR